jgi:digeranylgeranylglycerophospholipid reductase
MPNEVSIVGGGVVGLLLAKRLAQKEIPTTVYESKKDIAEGAAKASGIISVKGLEDMKIDYKPSIINQLYGAVLHSGKQKITVSSKNRQAYVTDRAKLVRICESEAKEAGATIKLGKRMTKRDLLSMSEDDIIVGADGAVSIVGSTFEFPSIDNFVLTYKAEYKNANIWDKRHVELFFSNELQNGLFGWMAPYSETDIELGIGINPSSKQNSLSAFKNLIKNESIEGMIANADYKDGHASMIPLSPRKKTVKGNVMLVGDAAGQVKATTGGGLVFGSICAKIAAETIEQKIRNNKPLLNYEKAWRRSLGIEIKLHSIAHNYYSKSKTLESFFMLSKIFGIERFLSDHGDMDMPSLTLKRLFLRSLAK